jgi:hypothetical protein
VELIKAKVPEDCQIYLTSDYHYGALNASKSSLEDVVETVASEENSYLCNLGDSIECILPNDKRFATCALDWQDRLMTPEAQAEAITQTFAPIKDKILVWMLGNHEHKLINTINFARKIANNLNVPYGSAVCKLHLQFETYKPIKFFLAHGSRTLTSNAKDDIQRTANMKAALKIKMQRMSADAIGMFCGHGHQLIAVDPTAEEQLYLTDNGKELKQHYRAGADQNAAYIPPESRWYGMTGSFLKLFSPPGSESVSYSEMALYAPSEIGCLVATIRGGKMVALEKLVY